MHWLRLMLAGNEPGCTGKSYCCAGNEKVPLQLGASLTIALQDGLFSDKNEHQVAHTGTGILTNYLTAGWLNEGDLAGQTGRCPDDTPGKMQTSDPLTVLLRNIPCDIMQNPGTKQAENFNPDMTAISAIAQNREPFTAHNKADNPFCAGTGLETVNNTQQAGRVQVLSGNAVITAPLANNTSRKAVPAANDSKQSLFMQPAGETVYRDDIVQDQSNSVRNGARQMLQHFLLTRLADNAANPGGSAVEKTPPMAGDIVLDGNLKTEAGKMALNGTITAANVPGAENSLSNPGGANETTSIASRSGQAEMALGSIELTTIHARSTVGETMPAVRGSEQALFMQLAEAIRGPVIRDGQGRTHIRLQLQPESLGEVVIRLVYKDGGLSTHFHAATEVARQAIENSLSQLRETLAAHNLNLQQSTVTAGEDQGRWAQGSNQEQRFNGFFQSPGNGHDEREETNPAAGMVNQKTIYPNQVNHFV